MTRSSLVMACRGLAAAAFAAGLLALASGCSAGQITQTDQSVPAVPGVNLQTPVPGGQLAIRNAFVVYPGTQGYPQGADAVLSMRILNNSRQVLRFIGGSSEQGTVSLRRAPLAGGSPAAASPTPSTSAGSPAPSTSAGASPGASPRPSATPTATPSAAPSPAPPASAAVEIRPGEVLILDAASPIRLTVALGRALKPGESVTVTLNFDNNVTLTDVPVPMDVPLLPASRVPLVTDENGHGG